MVTKNNKFCNQILYQETLNAFPGQIWCNQTPQIETAQLVQVLESPFTILQDPKSLHSKWDFYNLTLNNLKSASEAQFKDFQQYRTNHSSRLDEISQ